MTSKFSKSPLKKERERLLKKYSPMKKRSKLNKMAAISNKTAKTEANLEVGKPEKWAYYT